MPPGIAMSCWASEPDYALGSHLVRTLKATLAAGDGGALRELILTVEPVDAVLELDNDDWMKEPATQLPPGVLLGNQVSRSLGREKGKCSNRPMTGTWISDPSLFIF
jgi:ankyrin repeat/SOCS box protein 18